ncbi:unnamed protein product [Rhizopus stolonifer]
MAVSRSWHDFAFKWNGMWRDLDFSINEIDPKIVMKCIKYAQGQHVRRLSLFFMQNISMNDILKVVISENCQYLETLENTFKTKVEKLVYSTTLNTEKLATLLFQKLYKMIDIGTALSRLSIASNTLTHLYTLHLNEPINLQKKDLITIVSFCTQLVDLKITNSLAVTDDIMYNFPTKNRIKRINLSESRLLTDYGVKALIESQGGSLEKLVLFGCDSISPVLAAWATKQLREQVVKSRCA